MGGVIGNDKLGSVGLFLELARLEYLVEIFVKIADDGVISIGIFEQLGKQNMLFDNNINSSVDVFGAEVQ
ncbi:hypothetical protein, partial [Brevinema andersonii]|uniref:hypothetical protein n=1 Tax=Brevinema andersonii TaxID=34097 RepID=UPI001178364D